MRSLTLHIFILFGLLIPSFTSAATPAPKFAYVTNSISNTVSVYTINQTTGALTAGTAAATGTYPSAVAVDPTGKFAYVANLSSNTVSVYTINQTTGALTAGTAVATGSAPYSVTVDPSGKFAYVANGVSNDVSVYTINQTTGALIAGPTVTAGTRPTSVVIDPSGKFAYVANVDSNTVSVYTINQTTGALVIGNAVATGTKPNSVTVDPTGKFAYVANLNSNSVSVYTIDQTSGALTAGTAVAIDTYPNSVAVDPSGKFAYVAYQDKIGSGYVSSYTINSSNGSLTAGTAVPTGANPNSVTVDPSGKFVYVANSASNTVTIYTINQTTGELTAGTNVATGTSPCSIVTTAVRANQTITYNAAPSIAVGQFGTVSAIATSGITVNFTTTTPSICSVSGSTVTGIALGNCIITANQAGNANYYPASSVTQTITTFKKNNQTLNFGAPPVIAVSGTGTILVTVTSGLPIYTGVSTPSVCNLKGFTVTGVTGGTCTVLASQPGDETFYPATIVYQSFNIDKSNQSVSFGATPIIGPGGNSTVSATATSGLVVSFSSITPNICTVSGSTVTGVANGQCIIAADQAGNISYNAAIQVTQTITIGKSDQTLIFGVAPVLVIGKTGTVSATATSGLEVNFTSTTPAVCTINNSTVNVITIGTCSITADQAGNASYNAANQVIQHITARAIANVPKFAYIANGSTNSTISIYSINQLTGKLSPGTTVATLSNIKSIAVDPFGRFVFVLDSSAVSMYSINQTNGALTAGAVVATGANPNSLAVDPFGRFAYVANSGSSNVSVYTINESTGELTAGTAVSSGAAPSSVVVDPSGRFAYVANRNSNTISVYSINQTTGALTAGTAAPTGTSPNSVAVDPSGKFAYVANYGSKTVSVYTINQTTGALTTGVDVASGYGPTNVSVDPSGKFVFVANNNSYTYIISVYSINQTTGALTAGPSLTAGTNPYSITFEPSGKFAYVTNVSSTDVSVHSINQTNGTLTFGSAVTGTGNAVFVATTGGVVALPGVPTAVSAAPGDTQATVSFSPPTDSGGWAITGYKVTTSPGGFSTTGTTSPITVTGLTNGTSYTFTVTATTGIGTSASSAPSDAVTAKANQTVNFVVTPTIVFGGTGTVSANATSGLAVSFTSATPSVCTVSGNTVTDVTAGTCIIATTQAGDTFYSAANQVTQSITISKVNQTVSFGAAPNIIVGESGTVSVSVTSGLSASLTSLTPAICSVNNGIVTGMTVGACTIAANQTGNVNYNPAVQATQVIQIKPVPVYYSLNTSIVGSGSINNVQPNSPVFTCSSPNSNCLSASVLSGTSFQLYATPSMLFDFSGWSGGGCSSNPCQLALNGNVTVTATFTPQILLQLTGSVTPYMSFDSTYVDAFSGSEIRSRDAVINGDVHFNRPIDVTLNGGFDDNFTTINGITTIQGKLSINKGSIRVSNIEIGKPAIADFTLAPPLPVNAVQGTIGTTSIITTIAGGFNSNVALSVSGLTSGITATFNPASIAAPGGGSSILTITSGAATPVGTYTITVYGTSGNSTHITTLLYTVTEAVKDFTIKAPSLLTSEQELTTTANISTTALNGFSSSIMLTATGVPAGAVAIFSPSMIGNPNNGNSVFSITSDASTLPGTYSITVTGSGGGKTHSTIISYTVTAPSVASLSGNYSGSYTGADSGTIVVTLLSNGSITGTGSSSNSTNYLFTITGTVSAGGVVTMHGSGSAGPVNLTGVVSLQGGLVGTWSGSTPFGGVSGSGSFTTQPITKITQQYEILTVKNLNYHQQGGTLVLANSVGDVVSVTADGSITFQTPLTAAVRITRIVAQPTGQFCAFTKWRKDLIDPYREQIITSQTSDIYCYESPCGTILSLGQAPAPISLSEDITKRTDTTIGLNWQNQIWAYGYNVYYGKDSNVVYNDPLTQFATYQNWWPSVFQPFSIFNLEPDTTYFFAVTSNYPSPSNLDFCQSRASAIVAIKTAKTCSLPHVFLNGVCETLILPVITSFTPTSGATGTVVTITGKNFSVLPINNTVTFNGVPATVTSSTSTSLTVTVPVGVTSGYIKVSTAGGTATSGERFTVQTGPVSPSSITLVDALKGTTVALITFDPTLTIPGTTNYKDAIWWYTTDESSYVNMQNMLGLVVSYIDGYWVLDGTCIPNSVGCSGGGVTYNRITGKLSLNNAHFTSFEPKYNGVYITGDLYFNPI